MNSEGEEEEKERASDHPAGFAEDIRPLHDCACYFISLVRLLLERITHFPFPIGTIIGWAEYLVDRWTHPLTQALQCRSLSVLASIDDQIFCLVEGCGLCSKSQLKVILSQFYTEGLVGTSAGLWIKYELAVKEDIRKAVSLADRVPLINLVTPIFLSLITPSARAVSDWLLKLGERRAVDKITRTVDTSLALILKQEVGIEGHDTVVTKWVQVEGPVIELDVADVQCEGQNVGKVHDEGGCAEERNVRMGDGVENDALHAKENTIVVGCAGRFVKVNDTLNNDDLHSNVDVSVNNDVPHGKKGTNVDEVHFEQIDVSAEGIVEDGVFCRETDVSVNDLQGDKAVPASEKIRLSYIAEVGDDSLPDVLEMLESSWLLGTSTFPRNAPSLSQKKHTSSFGLHSRRGFFNG